MEKRKNILINKKRVRPQLRGLCELTHSNELILGLYVKPRLFQGNSDLLFPNIPNHLYVLNLMKFLQKATDLRDAFILKPSDYPGCQFQAAYRMVVIKNHLLTSFLCRFNSKWFYCSNLYMMIGNTKNE